MKQEIIIEKDQGVSLINLEALNSRSNRDVSNLINVSKMNHRDKFY